MSHAAELPLWAALLVALFLLLGSALALVGTLGLFRLQNFYYRMHAPTLGTSWGVASIVLASIICFSVLGSRLVIHEILLGIFITVTMPIGLILLGRVALYRDRLMGHPEVPFIDPPKGILDEPDIQKNAGTSFSNDGSVEKNCSE